jgi:adhesin/invasin
VAGTTVATPPTVVVRDFAGNPVAGVTVTFAVASGSGTITGATQVTNASGVATLGSLTYGAAGTTTVVTASAPSLPTVFFAAVANP